MANECGGGRGGGGGGGGGGVISVLFGTTHIDDFVGTLGVCV